MTTPSLITPFFGNDVGGSVAKVHDAAFGAGHGVIVAFAGFSGSESHATGVTIDGEAASLDVNSVGAGGSYLQVWSVGTVPGSSDDVLITFADGSSNYLVGAILELPGALTLIAANAIFDNNGQPTREATSVGGAPAIGDVVLGVCDIGPDTATSGWSEAFNSVSIGSAMTGQGLYREAVASGDQTASLQVTSGANCDVGVAVYRAAAGPSFNAGRASGSNSVL